MSRIFLSSKKKSSVPRNEQRAATRERLIAATVDLLRKGGVSAVSTVSITRKAGIVQSGFYMHFKNVDECLQVAAERVAEQIGNYVAAARREMHRIDPDDLDLLREHCANMLELFRKERKFSEIFLHHRHDKSALGKVMQELNDQLEADLVEDLRNVLFGNKPVPKKQVERVKRQAEIILGAVLAVGEGLVEKRITDIAETADLLAINIMSATNAAFLASD